MQWENGAGLQDLQTWGTARLFKFLELFDEAYGQNKYGPEDGYAVFLYYEMKNILFDMDEVIDRFGDESNPEGAKKRAERAKAKLEEKTPEVEESRRADLLRLLSSLTDSQYKKAEKHIQTLLFG